VTPFKAFRNFNDPELRPLSGVRARIHPDSAEYFPGDGLPQRIARALAARKALPVKELFESFEFFERTRRRARAAQMADLCCGHGLTGVLFAAFERRVERVLLVDRRRTASFDTVLEAVASEAPWVRDKVEYLERSVERIAEVLPQGTSVLAVHACGVRTDRCIDAGLATGGRMALMPCCYYRTASDAPRALREALGRRDATDVHRTYRLEAAGYKVDWSSVPAEITAMHRILVAVPRA
jgi:hypothetical protein